MSKRGGHLWIFLATPLLACECGIYVYDLARRLGVPVKGTGLADGIEVFPKHDAIGPGEFGNAIRGPLGIHRGANRRFWFYGADYTLEDQIAYLNRLQKVTEEELRKFIVGKERPQPELSSRLTRGVSMRRQSGNGRSEFRILDHVGSVRKMWDLPGEVFGYDLGAFAEGFDVEPLGMFLRFAGTVLPPFGDGNGEGGDGCATGGVLHFRVFAQIPDQQSLLHGVVSCN
jgi:hypothetical protein